MKHEPPGHPKMPRPMTAERRTESEDALTDPGTGLLIYLEGRDDIPQPTLGTLRFFARQCAALAARPSQVRGSQPVHEPHQGPHEFRCVECGADLSQAKAIDFPVELPTFTYSPDTCSVHGKIGDSVSIAAHLQEAHNISWAEYQNLIDAKVSAAKLVIGNRNSDMIDERIEKALDEHLKTWHDMGDP